MGKLHSKHGEALVSWCSRGAALLSSNCIVLFFFFQAAICKPRESPEGKRTFSRLTGYCYKLCFWGLFLHLFVSKCIVLTVSKKKSVVLKKTTRRRGWSEPEHPPVCVFVSGDSFVVNACLARKGIDDWLVKQKYYQQDYHQHKNNCALTPRVSTLFTHARTHARPGLAFMVKSRITPVCH